MATEERPRRRRTGLLALAWLATAAIAIGTSGWAVGLASRQVTDPIAPGALGEVTRSVAVSPSPAPSPAVDPSPADATAGPAATTTRTVGAVGGRAAFRFQDGAVTLDWATPAAGFEVDVEQESGELRVRFRAEHHESRIFAALRGGEPDTRVEERPDDD